MKKNILFLFPDQHRGDWLPYDTEAFSELDTPELPVHMDNIRSLMDNGTTFTRAVSNSPLCVPARACLASGMNYDRCQVYNNDFCYPLQQKTFYSVLKDHGYNVGGVGKFDLHKPILYWGRDGWIPQLSDLGFTQAIDSEGKYDLLWSSFYEPKGPYSNFLHEHGLLNKHAVDYLKRYYNAHDVRPTELPEYAYSDNWLTQNAITLLDDFKKEDKPWFLMVNFTGPHNPWDITTEMRERWENVEFPLPSEYTGDPESINSVRQNYAAMLENIDRNIGLLLDKLREDGTLENTLVVYSSDHGEMMGDRNRYFKSVASRGSVHIPLVVSGPGIKRHVYSDALVQLNDLAATFTEFAGCTMPEDNDSISVLPLATGEKLHHRSFQVSGLYHSPTCSEYPEYGELQMHSKQKPDHEYIEEFNQFFNIPSTEHSMKKMDYHKDWKCVITEKYKLVQYPDDTYELYDLQDDPWETTDIAPGNLELIDRLSSLSKLQIPESK